MDAIHPLSPQSGWTGHWAQALNLHAGRPPLPGQPPHHSLPVLSGAALLSVLQPAWFLLSGRAGAPPVPVTSPTGCDSWQLWRPDLLLSKDKTVALSTTVRTGVTHEGLRLAAQPS